MTLYYITDTNWIHFVESLIKQFNVYGLVDEGEYLYWEKVKPENVSHLVINRYRGTKSIKPFFFPAKEEVTQEPSEQKTVLIGPKACDLGQLRTADAVFLGGVTEDPYYKARRQRTIIISADCDACLPTCFCTQMGEKPHPEKGFDLNLSPARAGYLVEVGTAVGEGLVSTRKHFFQKPQNILLQERDAQRAKIDEQVRNVNREFTWTDAKEVMKKGQHSQKWEEIAKPCVECDACRFACGSCYCFLLAETGNLWGKVRSWDSCQSCGYARVAGGGNPRKTKAQRLRNLYQCKLLYRHENFGFSACTGCGRCIEVCQGKIDMRKSLQKLKDEQDASKNK